MTPIRPATRVANTICFEGGYVRELTRWERVTLWLGVKTTVANDEPPRWYLADRYERMRHDVRR